ncbi:energy transducer TonB [Flavobacterium psychrotolerans]|uniref:Ferric siderophore ABC transporter substrate-binding protein n=1 Tax=Flavobacterium psychrotolerans TaxID=2169410 RepID=A0A2U1JQK1_9FLAO|nr:energy transducer TonB [Flavobacterium psychrotolerans]PWA07229.1 ferric siderophore ABC transporter substrate-binding protein [Flavobacterium psychrotolerans]
MSKLSIYENRWINLVFEGKNKEYGAYQLRQESEKTTLLAFFMGLSLIASLISISVLINFYIIPKKMEIEVPDYTNIKILLSNIRPNIPKEPNKYIVPIEKKSTGNLITKDQLVNPVIIKSIATSPIIEKNTDDLIANDPTTIETNTTNTNTTGTGIETAPSDTGTTVNTTETLDKLPEFPGGVGKFYSFVGKNFEKPELDDMGTIRIYVSFVIEKDGSMTDIQVERDPGYGLAKEAIRVLKSLKTKWAPGMIKGKAVRTAYNLPIIVQMQ